MLFFCNFVVRFDCFQSFLESEDEFEICNAAFQVSVTSCTRVVIMLQHVPFITPLQMVILARVIVDVDQVTLTAEGVTRLVRILRSQDDNAVILAGALAFNDVLVF